MIKKNNSKEDIYQKLLYKNETIEYLIIRKKVKNINIRIKQNGKVYISCKKSINQNYIENVLIKKFKWIQKCQKRYKNSVIWFDNSKLKNGCDFLFQGDFFEIKIIQGDCFDVFFNEKTLLIKTPNKRGFKGKFNEWYLFKIEKVFTNILNNTLAKFEKFNINSPTLNLKNMTSRWGTCNKNLGKITLNKHLIKAPTELLEYVCMHECCHLIHNNHSRDFYALLTKQMPDWKTRKALLNKF